MGILPDGQRTGHGFLALRKRYIRRATFLTSDREFIRHIEVTRSEWNQEYPQFRIGHGNEAAPSGLPQALELAFGAHLSAWSIAEATMDQAKASGAADETLLELLRAKAKLLQSDAPNARDWWYEQASETAGEYFPLEDFPNPFPNMPFHPASDFVSACLHRDPRLIDDVAALIPEMTLEPIDLFPYEADLNLGDKDVVSDGDLLWYLPLYPGITEADIRRAAPTIVQRVNEIYGTRTARARIIALRSDGLTHRQIADRLGLTEQTVSSTLRNADKVSPEFD